MQIKFSICLNKILKVCLKKSQCTFCKLSKLRCLCITYRLKAVAIRSCSLRERWALVAKVRQWLITCRV